MGNCLTHCQTHSLKNYTSYIEYEVDLKKYLSDGCAVAIFIDRSQSNTQQIDQPCNRHPKYPETFYKHNFNKHWLPDDVRQVMQQFQNALHNPSLISECYALNNYLKILLLLSTSTLPVLRSLQFYFYTFGGENERATHVTFWGKMTIVPTLKAYITAVNDPQEYGRETSYQGIVDASMTLSSEIQVPLLSLIVTDGIVSEHCRQPSEQALIKSSNWPIYYVVIIDGNVSLDYMLNISGKKFDNITVIHFDEIINNSSIKWKEDLSKLVQAKVLNKLPQQFKECIRKKIMYNVRSDRPKNNREKCLTLPTRPLYELPTESLYPEPPSYPAPPESVSDNMSVEV